MTNNTFRLSCEQLEGRDLPSPVAGIQRTPVIQRPAVAAPVIQRTLAPVVTPVQPPVITTLPAPTPGTMTAPRPGTNKLPTDNFGKAVEAIAVPVGISVTAVRTGAELFFFNDFARAAERFGQRADYASLIGPAVDAANRTGSAIQVGTAVLVNVNVQVWGGRVAQWVGGAVGGRIGAVVGASILTALFPAIPTSMLAGALVGARVGNLLGQGGAAITFTLATTWKGFQHGVNAFSQWVADQYQPANGLIPGSRPAPTVVVPRGR